jgi:rhodanese-related sulfurtransferase
VKHIAMRFKNVKCLAGGVEAWKKAGYPIIITE